MHAAVPLLTRLTATAAVSAPPHLLAARPIAVMIIGDRPEGELAAPGVVAPAAVMTDALARFRPTVVVVDGCDATPVGLRLARRTGARVVGLDMTADAPTLCRKLAAVGRPGDRMVVFHGESPLAPLRRCVAGTADLKLVEASAWLGL